MSLIGLMNDTSFVLTNRQEDLRELRSSPDYKMKLRIYLGVGDLFSAE